MNNRIQRIWIENGLYKSKFISLLLKNRSPFFYFPCRHLFLQFFKTPPSDFYRLLFFQLRFSDIIDQKETSGYPSKNWLWNEKFLHRRIQSSIQSLMSWMLLFASAFFMYYSFLCIFYIYILYEGFYEGAFEFPKGRKEEKESFSGIEILNSEDVMKYSALIWKILEEICGLFWRETIIFWTIFPYADIVFICWFCVQNNHVRSLCIRINIIKGIWETIVGKIA